jgi:hypothetical protein
MMTMRWFLLVLAFATNAGLAADVAGVRFADSAEVLPGQALALNGAGLRKRAFFDVYAMGLYVAQRRTAAPEVIALPGAKRVAIQMLRDVGADQFTGALVEGMKDNLSEAEYRAVDGRVQQLVATMAQVKEAKKGMQIALDWVPSAGTRISIDGKPAGAPIAGEDFYRALLRIWLGDQPVSADLKKALLGGS